MKAKTRRMLDRRNRLFGSPRPHTSRVDSDIRTLTAALSYRFGYGRYYAPDSVATINAQAALVDELLAEFAAEESAVPRP